MSRAKPKDDLMLQIILAWNNATPETRQEALAYLRASVEGKRH